MFHEYVTVKLRTWLVSKKNAYTWLLPSLANGVLESEAALSVLLETIIYVNKTNFPGI